MPPYSYRWGWAPIAIGILVGLTAHDVLVHLFPGL